MKKTTRTARKVLSVFLAVLMMLTTLTVAVPGIALAADGDKYYVKVYVNIYDGSDGYGGIYSVEESTGKPKNYSWATNDGWYGRINMTGFTVFGEKGDYDAQDVSTALLEAEKLNTYYAMSGLSDNNANGDWDSKAIAKTEYTFVLDSFPVEIFWMNDENNWDGGNTGFAIRKLTVATSEGGTEHTMWEGLAGSDSETYNYYGSITPTGIHTCFEDYAKNYDMNDYKFYKAITTSSQRAWTDPYTYGSAGTYYLNEYANGGVSATFSEGATSVASTVDYIDTSSTDTYYVNYTNHSKTQIAEITGTYNDGNFVSSPYGIKLNPGETRSFEINKSNYSKLAKYNNAANFTFEYTLSNVYASDELNAPLAKFTQPTYIGLWNEANDSPKYITDEDGDGSTGYTLKMSDNYDWGNNSMTMTNTFQVTEGIIERNSATTGSGSNSVTFNYNYYVDVSNVSTWEDTGLRIYVTENEYYRLPFQPKEYPSECGTITLSGNYANTDAASITIADIAFTNVTEDFWYSHSQASGYSTYGYYNQKGTPMWATQGKDAQATFFNNNPGWLRFAGTMIEPSAESTDPAKIVMDKMVYRENQNGQKAYFSGTINVYAFDKAELRDYIQKTLLDFAPMSLRYNTTAFETYQNKLAAAMNVLADQKTNQLTINSALAALKSAVEALQTTDNLINQVAELTHTQYVDDIASEVAASIPERYVLISLGEHTVPQNSAYIGNGEYKNATNKNADLKTNYSKADTKINILNYRYWNIDYSAIDSKIADLETAINNFDGTTYNQSFKTNLQNAKDNLEAMKATVNVINTPTAQEDVEILIINADNLIAHLGNNMRVHQWIEDDNGNYYAESDEDTHWYTCKICGYELVYEHTFAYENIDALQHKATCVRNNDTLIEGCGYSFNENHIWVEGETVATSCTEANVNYSCVCGATKTEAVTVSNHKFAVADNGDGTHISKCTECGANEPDAVAEAHTYTYVNNNDGTHTATCTVCQATETVAHTFANPVLARPTDADNDGVWENGTYTTTCVCGATKTEDAERADYSELKEAIEALESIKDDANLSDAAKVAINNAIAAGKGIAQDLVTAEQDKIDALVKELQKVKADADEAIENKELGVENITEATSGVKVQFVDKNGLGEIDSVQIGKDDAFKIRVANGNADSTVTITDIQGTGLGETDDKTLASGESVDYDITVPATSGIVEYTITYTIDGLKDAEGNAVTATTKAYLYVKAKAYQPYHYVDEKCANGNAHPYWNYYLDSTYYGDFELINKTKAPYDSFGNDNLVQDGTSITDYVKEQYDYENDSCYAGCTDSKWASGDAHAATYRYYIDTSLADTYEKAGLRARLVESTISNYDNAPFIYVRLANNDKYLEKIVDSDKTFSVTIVPSATSNVPKKTWTATSNGDDTVSELINENEDEWIFGAHAKDSTSIATGIANFAGAIPQKTEDAKLMFSWRMEFNKGTLIKQAEAVTMTTHLYITSYDKAELRSATEAAEQAGYNSAYYNTEKYEAYEEALKDAKEVLGKAETNQAEIDEATAALKNAIAELAKAENEAKFVLTVTHSIYNGVDKNGNADESNKDYYLLAVGETVEASLLSDDVLENYTVNKHDDATTFGIEDNKDTEKSYNYWYIDYSGVQGAIDAADAIINDTENGYSEEYKQKAQDAKDALEDILEDKEATTTPESQGDVDTAIGAVSALTHTCVDADKDHKCDTCGATMGTHADTNNDHNCDYCGGKISDCEDADPKDHNCDVCGTKLSDCADVTTDNDHNCDVCGKENVSNHNYVNHVLTRPTFNEETKEWNNGYYTSTCNCGATSTTEAKRAKYEAYDEAVAALNALLADATLTDAAKTEINNALEANKIADNYIATTEEQKIVDDAAAALNAVLDMLTNDEGKLEDAYKKPNSTAAEKAVADAEALEEKIELPEDVKADIDKLRDTLDDILEEITADDNATAEEYQERLDAVEDAAKEILDKYAGCADGNHTYVKEGAIVVTDPTCTENGYTTKTCDICDKVTVEVVENSATDHNYDIAGAKLIARPTQNEDGTWNNDGKYEATCLNDEAHKLTLEGVKRADYTAFDEAVAELKEIAKFEGFTDTVKNAILDYAAKLENGTLDSNNDGTPDVLNNYVSDYEYKGVTIKGEQDLLNAFVNELTKEGGVIDTFEASKNDPANLKPDYEAWEEAETAYDALDKTNVKDIIIAEANKLKEDIDKLQKTEGLTQATATQDDIDSATARLNEIIAGITDGSLKNPADFTEVNKDLADAKDKAENNDVTDGVQDRIDAIEDKLEALEGANADKQGEIDELEDQLEDIIAGIENGTLVKPDYEAWEDAEGKYDALDKTNVKADIITEVETLKQSIAGKQANDTLTQATATQKDIDDATTRLNAIIAGITDGSLVKPDYTDYNAAVNAYNGLADVMTDEDKDAVENIKAEIAEIPADGTKAQYQTQVDKAAADIVAINGKYGECASGNHSYNSVTTEPTCTTGGYTTHTCTVCGHSYKDAETTANGHTWDKTTESFTADTSVEGKVGYYTYGCSVDGCDGELKIYVEAADYKELEELVDALEKIITDNPDLTDEAKAEIQKAIDKAEALDDDLTKPATEDGITTPDGQDKIDALVEELSKVKTDAEKAIEDGSALKPNYTDWKTAEKSYDALDKTNVKDEIITEAEALKTEIAGKQADDTLTQATATQDDIDEATKRLNEIVAGITDGTLVKPDYTVYNAIVNAYEILKENMSAEDTATVEGIKAEIAEIPADGTKAQYQDQINQAAADIAAINAKYGECAKGNHTDDDNDHNCDICGTKVSDCGDGNNDHNCDVCGDKLSDCADNNNDHNCDVCGDKLSDCADSNNDHNCDVCGDKLSYCTDNNNDHNCDVCGAKLSDCADNNNDHNCDVCGTELSQCVDGDNDHDCDVCGDKLSDCADSNNDHNCDVCGDKLSDCADSNNDHNCDVCGGKLSDCADGNNDHNCDVCGDKLSDCTDVTTDSDHNCDVCGKEDVTEHDYVNPVLTRPAQNDDGTWNDGYYTSTCNCGDTSTTEAKRANYTAYDEAVADLNKLLADKTITDAAKTEITNVLNANEIANNYIATEEEQKIIDDAVAALKVVLDKLTNDEGKLKDEYKKPDYSEWDAAEEAYDALDKTNVKAEIVDEAEALKAEIAEKQADDTLTQATATQKDIDDATARLNEIVAGIIDGTLKDSADYTEVDKDLADAKDKAENNNVVDSVKEDIKEIEDKLNELKNDPTTNADDQDEIDALEKELEKIIAGIEDGSLLLPPDYSRVEAKLEEIDKTGNLNKDTQDEVDAIRSELQAIKDKTNPVANARDDQPAVDALEDSLDDILAKIADGSGVAPDYKDVEKAIKDAEKIEILTDTDREILEGLKEELNKIKNDPTSNKKDDQSVVDAIKETAITISEKYAPCLKGEHTKGSVVEKVPSTCTERGYTIFSCAICGTEFKDEFKAMIPHNPEIIPGRAPTCSAVGLTEGKKCTMCNEIIVPQEEIAKLPHTDADEDGVCDNCHTGGIYDGCSCLCHNTHWFWQIVYMIFRIIWKVFKIHPTCACGRIHY